MQEDFRGEKFLNILESFFLKFSDFLFLLVAFENEEESENVVAFVHHEPGNEGPCEEGEPENEEPVEEEEMASEVSEGVTDEG